MRCTVFLAIGLLELAVAAVLVTLGFELPTGPELEQGFDRAEAVSRRTGTHVRLLQQQVRDLRRPELHELSERLERQTKTVTSTLRHQSVDYDMVKTVGDALGDVSKGLEGLAETLDPNVIGKLGEGLGATASYLDEKVIPSASAAADNLEKASAGLQADAKQLGSLLRETPPDLKAVREVYDGLGRFSAGLDRMHTGLKLNRFDTMREGFEGLETSLTTGADQVERLASYRYPVITMDRFKPSVSQRPFWPEGDRIADGMRRAAKGATAARDELGAMAADLPRLRDSLDEGRKMADKTREALGLALQHQHTLEALLKDVPGHTARLADALPQLSADLAKMLRDTKRLATAAESLREAQRGLDAAVARWPELQKTLSRSATLLAAMQSQLNRSLEHRQEHEAGLKQTVLLADNFAILLPLFTAQMEQQLRDQERALDDLGQSIDEVGATLPVYAQTASRVTQTARWLLWLVAGIVGLHGLYLAAGTRLGRRYSG